MFLDADGVDGETMQKIAREMNLSESSFVMQPYDDRATHHVRIFTPGAELPFAGHPTIGTAFVLQQFAKATPDLAFQMDAGIIPVRKDSETLWMTPPAAEALSAAFDRAAVAQAIGLPVSCVMMPPQVFGGHGVEFLCVLLDTEQNVDWVMLDRGDLVKATTVDVGEGNVLICSYQGGKAYARMFAAVASNIGEDPATGSAVAPLCAALGWWRLLDPSRTHIDVHQGVAMGRPSQIKARFTVEGTYVQQVIVGGTCVPVYQSTLEL